MKFGDQFMLYHEHQQLTTNFNGTYTFGGGTAPVLDGNNQPIPGETDDDYGRAAVSAGGAGAGGWDADSVQQCCGDAGGELQHGAECAFLPG